MTDPPGTIPRYAADLFTDDALDDPWPHLRALRDAGPVVWLDAHGTYATARYDDVRRILADHDTFVSGEGVALNGIINDLGHLAFGYGEHACVGMGLARLEGAAVLSALVERVEIIELTGTPVRKRNNVIRSFASPPVSVTPKARP